MPMALCFFILFAGVFAMPLYGQRKVAKKHVTTIQPKGDSDLQKVQKLLGKQLKGYTNYGNEEINLPVGLIERDILGYYDLHDKYDSPLKLKLFKQSSEYESLLKKMEVERNKLLADTFFIVEKVHKTNYGLKKHSFYFDVPQTNILYSTTHYIDYGYVGIISPLLKENGLQVTVHNESDALEIENDYENCRLVYVFTVNEELSKQTEKTGLGCQLICDMQELYFVNLKKSKVYYSAETGYVLKKYVQYDNDVYASYKFTDGYVMPCKYFLKSDGQYIEIKADEDFGWDMYLYEKADDHYYVFGTDDKKYQLAFKPEYEVIREKDEAYFKKCEEVKKDYLLHLERYKDVTIIDKTTNESTGSYVDRDGCEWVLESEMNGFYLLERENVYVLTDELRFIQRK